MSLLGLDPAELSLARAARPGRTYGETNCYTDILIELLHARGDEPLAALGCTVRMDFEGDQWTFFKPFPDDLELLFGIDVHEMQPYRPLPEQAAEQIAAGPDADRRARLLVSARHAGDELPLASTSRARSWSRASTRRASGCATSTAPGCTSSRGEDYRGVFRLGRAFSEDVLPPYTELVRFDAGPRLHGAELREAARALLRRHLAHRPASNPFVRFAEQLERDLPRLLEGDASDYHAYAFATVRMAGSAFEVAASQAQWLLGDGAGARVGGAATDRRGLQGPLVQARAPPRRSSPSRRCPRSAPAWDEAMELLDAALA